MAAVESPSVKESRLPRTRGAHAAALLAVAAVIAIVPACRRRAPQPAPPAAVSAPDAPPRPAPEPASASSAGYDFRAGEKAAVEAFLRQTPTCAWPRMTTAVRPTAATT